MVNLSTVAATAIAAAAIALHSEALVYWIGSAGCLILIPTVVVVLALPLLTMRESSPAPATEQIIATAEAVPSAGEAELLPSWTPALLARAARIDFVAETDAGGGRRHTVSIVRRYPGETDPAALVTDSTPARWMTSARL
jgi:hypothetical protein